MKLHALMNRLEDLGEDREVIVVIGTLHLTAEYDVVGAEPDDKAASDEGATVVLLLRERPPASD